MHLREQSTQNHPESIHAPAAWPLCRSPHRPASSFHFAVQSTKARLHPALRHREPMRRLVPGCPCCAALITPLGKRLWPESAVVCRSAARRCLAHPVTGGLGPVGWAHCRPFPARTTAAHQKARGPLQKPVPPSRWWRASAPPSVAHSFLGRWAAQPESASPPQGK